MWSRKRMRKAMWRRRLEWFGHVNRRGETEHIRAIAEMKMDEKRPRGRLESRWNETVRGDMKAWNIKDEWATDRERRKFSARPATPNRETAAKGEKGENICCAIFTSHLIEIHVYHPICVSNNVRATSRIDRVDDQGNSKVKIIQI